MRDHVHPAIKPLVEASLSPREFDRRVGAPLTDEERAETLALVRWFTHRYPTVRARMAYARRKYREWTRPAVIRPPNTNVVPDGAATPPGDDAS